MKENFLIITWTCVWDQNLFFHAEFCDCWKTPDHLELSWKQTRTPSLAFWGPSVWNEIERTYWNFKFMNKILTRAGNSIKISQLKRKKIWKKFLGNADKGFRLIKTRRFCMICLHKTVGSFTRSKCNDIFRNYS